ncbi:SIS domain-containing protein [uncultured Amnibacterium sp.]|uniref:SIS domain-containing protein n=1 Tax=uncultured Amnibacterium sp. TaxID=1631851 RepID=UPI0035CA3439
MLVISRSGTTVDVIDFLDRLPAGHRVAAIIGDQASPLARLPQVVDLAFADEVSVVQTRFATTGLALLRASLRLVPPTLLEDATAATAMALPVEDLQALRQVVFLGHRWTNGLAQEAALKLREAAGMWTEAYPVMEYQHGPISCAGPRSLIWAFEPVPASVEAGIRATGAQLYVPPVDPQASMVAVHRLALALALAAGRDPDRPPHLSRSVVAV